MGHRLISAGPSAPGRGRAFGDFRYICKWNELKLAAARTRDDFRSCDLRGASGCRTSWREDFLGVTAKILHVDSGLPFVGMKAGKDAPTSLSSNMDGAR